MCELVTIKKDIGGLRFMAVLKLKPSFKDYIWGGSKLKTDFGKVYDGEVLAESWELSCHPDGPSWITNGEYAGKTLREYIDLAGREVLGDNCRRFLDFPILTKFIDAKDNLSVQVHPNNAYALRNKGQYGKTEMWYVLDCEEGACLYYDFKKAIDVREFEQRIADNTLLEVLNEVPVKKGDVFFIEAGIAHAIGKGIVIAEIQQNSNLTYRIYDYGRVGKDGQPRELHIHQALAVTKTEPATVHKPRPPYIAECDYFRVRKVFLMDGAEKYRDVVGTDSFVSLLAVDGRGIIRNQGEMTAFLKGDSMLLPAGSGSFEIEGKGELLLTTIGSKENPIRIGIDIGGTNIKIGLVDAQGQIVASSSVATEAWQGSSAVIERTAEAVLELLSARKLKLDDCVGIGIGCPGTVNAGEGLIVYSNNLAWKNVEIIKELQHYIPLPAVVENDADCAAVGEWKAGSGQGCRNMVMLTIGTGLGSGIIINGRLFTGGSYGGAEIGHWVLVHDGEPCTCGQRGCLEAYVSASALRREGIRAAQMVQSSLLNELCGGTLEHMSAKLVFEAADAGDEAAKEIVEKYIHMLGDVVTSVTNVFRPEKIILGGGVCDQGTVLTDPLNDYVRQHAFGRTYVPVPEIERAVLGNQAGIIGAANLI